MERKNLNKEELPDRIYCPLYKKEIDVGNCFDISMVVDKLAPERIIPKEVRNIDTYREICKTCQYHDI